MLTCASSPPGFYNMVLYTHAIWKHLKFYTWKFQAGQVNIYKKPPNIMSFVLPSPSKCFTPRDWFENHMYTGSLCLPLCTCYFQPDCDNNKFIVFSYGLISLVGGLQSFGCNLFVIKVRHILFWNRLLTVFGLSYSFYSLSPTAV